MPLNVKPDQSRLTTLLTDTVVLLCKNGLNFQGNLRIVGVLGITIDDSDVFIVHLNENVSSSAPDIAPDVTSYSVNPKTSGVDGCRVFHAEKRVVPLTPRSGKSSGRSSNKLVDDNAQDLRSKESTALPEDGRMKMDRGLRKSDHTSEIRIKEENVEVIEEETRKNIVAASSYGRDDEDCGTQVSSRREKRTFRWTREIGHVSIPDPTDYVVASNEMFAEGEGRGVESQGGMDAEDEWNLDMLALSSLPGASSEGDAVPPWPGYVWGGGGGGGTYPQQCLTSGEMSRTQSQSMSFEGRSSTRGRGASTDADPRGRIFSCEVPGCGRTFLRGSELYRHQRRKHGARHRRSPRGGTLPVRGGWSPASWNQNLHRT